MKKEKCLGKLVQSGYADEITSILQYGCRQFIDVLKKVRDRTSILSAKSSHARARVCACLSSLYWGVALAGGWETRRGEKKMRHIHRKRKERERE